MNPEEIKEKLMEKPFGLPVPMFVYLIVGLVGVLYATNRKFKMKIKRMLK